MTSDGAGQRPPQERSSPAPGRAAPQLSARAPDVAASTDPDLTARLARRVRAGAVAIVDQGVVSAAGLLTGIIVARACGQAGFGVFVLCMSVVLLLLELQGALISTPYLVNAPSLAGDEARRYGGSALLHQLGLAALTSLGLLVAVFLIKREHPSLAAAGLVLALGAPLITLRDFLRRHCFARLRFDSALVMDAGAAVLQVGGLAALGVVGALSAPLALATVAASSALASVVWLRFNRRDFAPRIRDAGTDAVRNWVVGRWVFASGIAWAAAAQLYPWLIVVLRGAEDVAVWGAAMGVSALLNVPLLAGHNLLGPRIARARASMDARHFRTFVVRVSTAFTVALFGAALPLFLLGGWLLGRLYGEAYTPHGGVVALLAAGVAFSAASFGFSRGLFCLNRADMDFAVNLAPLAVLLLLGPPLTSGRGVAGAALALLTAHALSAGLRAMALVFAAAREEKAPAP